MSLRLDDLIVRLNDSLSLLESGLSSAIDLSEQLDISDEDFNKTISAMEDAVSCLENAYVYLNDIVNPM